MPGPFQIDRIFCIIILKDNIVRILKRKILFLCLLFGLTCSLYTNAEQDKKPFRMLSLDGGGVRGILPAVILSNIERVTGKRITELFDMIVGTSTGGLIALYLNIPNEDHKQKFSAEQIVQLYKELSQQIFINSIFRSFRTLGGLISSKYSAKPFEELLKDNKYFDSLKLSDAVINVMVTSKNINTGRDFLFSSILARRDEKFNYPMWQAALSTAAAPLYFKPQEVLAPDGTLLTLVDGGVGSNNPAQKGVLHAMKELGINKDNIYMLSIGTGISDQESRVEAKGLLAGGYNILGPTINTLFSAQEEDSNEAVKAIIGDDHFFRVAPIIPDINAGLDNVSANNLQALEQIGQNTFDQNIELKKALCKMLNTDCELALEPKHAQGPNPCSKMVSEPNYSKIVGTPTFKWTDEFRNNAVAILVNATGISPNDAEKFNNADLLLAMTANCDIMKDAIYNILLSTAPEKWSAEQRNAALIIVNKSNHVPIPVLSALNNTTLLGFLRGI